ncbi:MAG: hypothetical protein LBH93_07930 [Chitinispirillales bacterium]|jgi:serine O-acetyltransferase|nr:hypothetical protein [Chitinispirillales bacterium]
MDINEWMNERLPQIVDRLEGDIKKGPAAADDGLDLPGRNDIYEMLDDIMAVLFPGYYSRGHVAGAETSLFVSDMLRRVSLRLGKHLRGVFNYHCGKGAACDACSCDERADSALVEMMESLPEIRAALLEDIAAAQDGDPAAKFFDEVLLSYPCVEAIATHRIAHRLYKLGVPIIPRVISERAHSRTGIDIHPGAEIGPRFFIDHGTGVVIGETCRIGGNVKIYQGVTLGAISPFDKDGKPKTGKKRHPDIEDDVIIYANATILGGGTVIGKGAVIGGNTWITKSVPPGSQIYNQGRE